MDDDDDDDCDDLDKKKSSWKIIHKTQGNQKVKWGKVSPCRISRALLVFAHILISYCNIGSRNPTPLIWYLLCIAQDRVLFVRFW